MSASKYGYFKILNTIETTYVFERNSKHKYVNTETEWCFRSKIQGIIFFLFRLMRV